VIEWDPQKGTDIL
jgi:hypothetical protein